MSHHLMSSCAYRIPQFVFLRAPPIIPCPPHTVWSRFIHPKSLPLRSLTQISNPIPPLSPATSHTKRKHNKHSNKQHNHRKGNSWIHHWIGAEVAVYGCSREEMGEVGEGRHLGDWFWGGVLGWRKYVCKISVSQSINHGIRADFCSVMDSLRFSLTPFLK